MTDKKDRDTIPKGQKKSSANASISENQSYDAIEQEQQNSQVAKVINLGREQNYLTYAQINDLMPNIVDTEHFDVIISMLESMSIRVYEFPPSEDELALMGHADLIPDADELEEAAAVLASVDEKTGRTTDPVRMYMREMGTVELLTREGEKVIAKRIEQGIYQVLKSLGSYPETVQLVLDDYDRFLSEEIRLSEIISGFADVDEEAPATNIGSMLEESQQEELLLDVSDDDEDGDAASLSEVEDGPNPEQAKAYFDELRENFDKALKSLREHGPHAPKTVKLLDAMSESFLKLKLTARQVDRLTRHFRQLRNHIRDFERNVMKICLEKAKIPRKLFIDTFPGQETDSSWLDSLCKKHEKKTRYGQY